MRKHTVIGDRYLLCFGDDKLFGSLRYRTLDVFDIFNAEDMTKAFDMNAQILGITRDGENLQVTAAVYQLGDLPIAQDNIVRFVYQQTGASVSLGDMETETGFLKTLHELNRNLDEASAKSNREKVAQMPEDDRKALPLKRLGLSRKIYNSLSESRKEPEIYHSYPWAESRRDLTLKQIITIGDLTELTEQDLWRYSNIGDSAVAEIKEKLAECGLSIKNQEETTGEQSGNVLERKIQVLDLGVGAYNGLRKRGIKTIGELIQCTPSQILSFKGILRVRLAEIQEALAKLGLSLAEEPAEEV